MQKKVAALGAALLVMLATAAAALAITNGTADGNRHPYVGLMVALDSDGVPLWRCSGSLLSPTVFLTAGHCVDGYCCNMPCNGNCQRCDATPGTCTPTANGTSPVNGRSPCGTDTRCYGTCDGNGSCGNFNNTVSCRNAQCSGSDYTKAATCDGAGNCPPPVTGTCDSAPCCSGAICAPPHGQCPG